MNVYFAIPRSRHDSVPSNRATSITRVVILRSASFGPTTSDIFLIFACFRWNSCCFVCRILRMDLDWHGESLDASGWPYGNGGKYFHDHTKGFEGTGAVAEDEVPLGSVSWKTQTPSAPRAGQVTLSNASRSQYMSLKFPLLSVRFRLSWHLSSAVVVDAWIHHESFHGSLHGWIYYADCVDISMYFTPLKSWLNPNGLIAVGSKGSFQHPAVFFVKSSNRRVRVKLKRPKPRHFAV